MPNDGAASSDPERAAETPTRRTPHSRKTDCFAHAGWSGQHQTMDAGCSYLHRVSSMRLTHDVWQVDDWLGRRRWHLDTVVELCLTQHGHIAPPHQLDTFQTWDV
jgi:hypothetical protein